MNLFKIVNKECTGLVFKANVQTFLDNRNNLVNTNKMVLLKRSSCKCVDCLILYDCYLEACLAECWPIVPMDIINGGLYSLSIINEHTDWESGIVDEFDLIFVELSVETTVL